MAGKSFSAGRIIVLGLELFALILINVAGYYSLKTAESTNPLGTFAAREKELDAYPVFTGTVVELEASGAVDMIAADQDGDWSSSPEFKPVDSVEIGIESISTARVKVTGMSGSRWFTAGNSTYVYSNVSNQCGGVTITKGKRVTFAYDENDDGYYTRVKAVKESEYFSGIFSFVFIVPSVLILIFTIVIMHASAKKKEDNDLRHNGVIAASVVMIVLSALSIAGLFGIAGYIKAARKATTRIRAHAPVIYIYDDSGEYINVQLDLNGDLTCTYPEYVLDEGWTVKASPEGILTGIDGGTSRFLFWEADLDMDYDLRYGYCVKGCDTETFLDEALIMLGLNGTEASDFKAYWLPLMENNPYNIITFQTTAYTDAAGLILDHEPDVEIRVNMLWYASDEYVEIEPQELAGLNPALNERHGLVVSEWGGEMIHKP